MAVKSATAGRDSALRIANEYRLAVAAERRKIAAMSYQEGCAALAEMIETTTDPALLSGRVVHYVKAVRRIGEIQAPRLIKLIQITDPDRRLRDLTYRQKTVLINELRRRS